MTDMARLLLMLGLAGTAVTFLGSASLWFFNEERRIRRALRRVLRSEPEAMIVAQGRGRGAGFSLASGLLAVTWERGAWCLVYRLDEVLGAELVVDGQVIARVYRGEPRRPLDQTPGSADQATLRLLLADATYPDFELDLWTEADTARRDDWSPRAAIQEGNRWMARVDAIVRQPLAPRAQPAAPAVASVAAPTAPRPAPVHAPGAPDDEPQPVRVAPPPPPRAPGPRFARPAARQATPEPTLPFGGDDDEDDGPPWDDDEDRRL